MSKNDKKKAGGGDKKAASPKAADDKKEDKKKAGGGDDKKAAAPKPAKQPAASPAPAAADAAAAPAAAEEKQQPKGSKKKGGGDAKAAEAKKGGAGEAKSTGDVEISEGDSKKAKGGKKKGGGGDEKKAEEKKEEAAPKAAEPAAKVEEKKEEKKEEAKAAEPAKAEEKEENGADSGNNNSNNNKKGKKQQQQNDNANKKQKKPEEKQAPAAAAAAPVAAPTATPTATPTPTPAAAAPAATPAAAPTPAAASSSGPVKPERKRHEAPASKHSPSPPPSASSSSSSSSSHSSPAPSSSSVATKPPVCAPCSLSKGRSDDCDAKTTVTVVYSLEGAAAKYELTGVKGSVKGVTCALRAQGRSNFVFLTESKGKWVPFETSSPQFEQGKEIKLKLVRARGPTRHEQKGGNVHVVFSVDALSPTFELWDVANSAQAVRAAVKAATGRENGVFVINARGRYVELSDPLFVDSCGEVRVHVTNAVIALPSTLTSSTGSSAETKGAGFFASKKQEPVDQPQESSTPARSAHPNEFHVYIHVPGKGYKKSPEYNYPTLPIEVADLQRYVSSSASFYSKKTVQPEQLKFFHNDAKVADSDVSVRFPAETTPTELGLRPVTASTLASYPPYLVASF